MYFHLPLDSGEHQVARQTTEHCIAESDCIAAIQTRTAHVAVLRLSFACLLLAFAAAALIVEGLAVDTQKVSAIGADSSYVDGYDSDTRRRQVANGR